MSKFLFITTKKSKKEILYIIDKLKWCGVLNFLIIYQDKKLTKIVKPGLKSYQEIVLNDENLPRNLFVDKTKNLQKIPLNVAISKSDFNTVPLRNGKMLTKYSSFLAIVAKSMNTSINFTDMRQILINNGFNKAKMQQELLIMFFQKNLDLSIIDNTFSEASPNFIVKMQDENCYLLNIPPEIPIIEQILFRPMDKICWILLGVVVAISAVIWKFFDAHWEFLFAIFGLLVNQWSGLRK